MRFVQASIAEAKLRFFNIAFLNFTALRETGFLCRVHRRSHAAPLPSAVPEPASIAMWGLRAIGLVFARRKRQQMKLAA